MIYMDKNLRVLFLDDKQVRHELFKKWYQGADHCYSYGECVQLLRTAKYNVVSLDHDLGEEDELCIPGLNNKHKTGTDVAQFIAGLVQKPDVAILHTYNSMGAKSMASILGAAGITTLTVPFGFNPAIYTQLAA